jgi:hypothetical protein
MQQLVARTFYSVLMLIAACTAQSTQARSVEGYLFDESVRQGGTLLRLNGVGVRGASVFKGYVAALYVPEKSGDAPWLIDQPGPKRLELRMLLGADAQLFIQAVHGGIQRTSSAGQIAELGASILAFDENLRRAGAVKPGDLVTIEYDPALGTHLALNGKAVGKAVAGAPFFAAFLRIFIGLHAQDPRLKADLLGARSAS